MLWLMWRESSLKKFIGRDKRCFLFDFFGGFPKTAVFKVRPRPGKCDATLCNPLSTKPKPFSTSSSVSPTHKGPSSSPTAGSINIKKGMDSVFPQTKVEGDQRGDERGGGTNNLIVGLQLGESPPTSPLWQKGKIFFPLSVRAAAHSLTAHPHHSKAKVTEQI